MASLPNKNFDGEKTYSLAKAAREDGRIGRNQLSKLLRHEGIIDSYNQVNPPYLKFFKTKIVEKTDGWGLIRYFSVVTVTEEGLDFIQKLIDNKQNQNGATKNKTK